MTTKAPTAAPASTIPNRISIEPSPLGGLWPEVQGALMGGGVPLRHHATPWICASDDSAKEPDQNLQPDGLLSQILPHDFGRSCRSLAVISTSMTLLTPSRPRLEATDSPITCTS